MGFLGKLFSPFSSDDKDKAEVKAEEVIEEVVETGSHKETAPNVDVDEESDSTFISDVGVLAESVKAIILDAVAPFTGNDDFVGFSLWVNDQSFHIINKEQFKTSLKASFDSMHLYSLGNGEINVIHGEPSVNDEASPISKKGILPPGKIWIRLYEKGKTDVRHAKAIISVFQGLGSCKEKEYVLNSDDKSVYRIGRGAISRKPGSAYRVNDIIIDDSNPDPSIQKLNNYVSSAQADVILDDGYFYLKAMPSGCRTSGGSPTKIIRDQEPMELRDSISSYRLKDGDIIELGKSVLLLFKILE